MEIFLWVIYFIVGAGAGLLSGLLGISGGIVTIPALVLIFNLTGFPQSYLMHTAMGTSLAAMILKGIAATWTHNGRKEVMWDLVLVMIPGILMGCILGAFFAHFISGILLQIVFGGFICFLGAGILFKKQKKKKKTEKAARPDKALYTWIGLGIGAISSFLGIGGGVFVVPLLLSYHYVEKKAIGTSAATGLFITILASIGYMYFGHDLVDIGESIGYVYIPAFLSIGLGTLIFAPIGTKLTNRFDVKKWRKGFAATLIIIGILLIFN